MTPDLMIQSIEAGHARGWTFVQLNGKRPTQPNWNGPLPIRIEHIIECARSGRNVGLRTGWASAGLFVVDADPGADITALDLPETVEVQTGRPGGRHFYYQLPEGVKLGNSSGKLGEHVDTRGDGGQVVFVGSVHPETGAVYQWAPNCSPDERAIAELPAEIIARLSTDDPPRSDDGPRPTPTPTGPTPARGGGGCTTTYGRKGLEGEVGKVMIAVEGRRNATLNVAAYNCGRLVGGEELEESDACEALTAAGLAIGLGGAEVRDTVASGIEKGKAKPKRSRAAAARSKARPTPPTANQKADDNRPVVQITTDEHIVIAQTIDALKADDAIFQRGGILVRVLRSEYPRDGIDRPDGSPIIGVLPGPNLRERMVRQIQFITINKDDEIALAHPPGWLVSAVDCRGEWAGIRHLVGISDAPILRPDGTIHQTPQYDARTGVLCCPGEAFPAIPEHIDQQAACRAADELLEVVCDFRFEAEEHRAAWMAGLLTPLGRFAFRGPAPLHLIDANVRGAGKGLLAQTIGMIALGREMPVSSYVADPDEMRKKLTSIALAGDRLILWDNIEGAFGNDALDRALTCTTWKDRILGRSQEIELPLAPAWFATGNNVQVAADTCRRIVHIRLDVLEERPEEREGFRHPDLLTWLRENRARLLTAGLTLLAGFIRAGRPAAAVKPYGSFEGWSSLIRQAVIWVGLPDPCLTRVRLTEASDTTSDALGQLLQAWQAYDWAHRGLTTAGLLADLYCEGTVRDEAHQAMRLAVEAITGVPAGRAPTPRQLGNSLKRFRRRVVGGLLIDTDTERNKHGMVWRLYRVGGVENEGAGVSDASSV